MAPMYTVSLHNSSGVLQAISQDYLDLAISRTVNAPDMAVIVYDRVSPNWQYLVMNAIVVITRQDTETGISATQEFAGIIRRRVRTIGEKTTIEVTCIGMMGLLATRIVDFRAQINNRSRWIARPAETIIKDLFNYNIGSLATVANGRVIDGRITGMTTTASAGTGTTLTASFAYQNLLTAMQKVADDGGGDFSLTYTAPASWVFAWHLGQLGTDRTATVRLSVNLGTIGELVVEDDTTQDYATAVIVAGEGEGLGRLIAARPATPPTGLDLREYFVDARNVKKATTAMLQTMGNVTLRKVRRRQLTYTATLLQNAALRYGRDYFLGDLVTIVDITTPITRKIQSVDLSFSADGKESVDVGLADNT